MRHFTEDRRKYKELILLISKLAAPDPNFGSTHLNKLLFFSDFIAYLKFGHPISGETYIRENHGPVPKGVRAGFKSPVNELIREKRLRRDAEKVDGGPKRMTRYRPVALDEPDLSLFSSDELELVNQVVSSFFGWRAGKLSKYTHEFPLWTSVAINETIPYETAFISPDQRLNEEQTKRVQEWARKRGWLTGKS